MPSWISRNIIAIVMVPGIIGLHWGWQKMQQIDELVPQHERKPEDVIVPLDAAAKVYGYVSGKYRPDQ